MDLVVGGLCGKARGGEVVVDAPTGVGVESLASERPPSVWAGLFWVSGAADVDPALSFHPVVKVGAFFWQETGVLEVALPVLDVELGVTNVQVANHDDVTAVFEKLVHAGGHRLEKLVLFNLLGGVNLARVNVGRDDGEHLATKVVVGLEPAARRVKIVGA